MEFGALKLSLGTCPLPPLCTSLAPSLMLSTLPILCSSPLGPPSVTVSLGTHTALKPRPLWVRRLEKGDKQSSLLAQWRFLCSVKLFTEGGWNPS